MTKETTISIITNQKNIRKMHSSLLQPLFLVTEEQLDVRIICSLINTGKRIVYMIVAGGYQNITSALRTQYLMYGDEFYDIAVFDSDSNDESVRMEQSQW